MNVKIVDARRPSSSGTPSNGDHRPEPGSDRPCGLASECSATRARRAGGGRTLDQCSSCVVRTLLAIGLTGPDAGGVLARVGEAADGLRESAILDTLVEAVRRSPRAEGAVRSLLARRLEPSAARFRGCSLAELARLWSEERHSLGGEELLALLWVVTSRSEAACRSFEQRLVDEISVLALKSLAASSTRMRLTPERSEECV